MIFSLEDYNGNAEFALFGEDYVNLSKYIRQDSFLYIKGLVKNKWGRPDEWECKPTAIRLLSEIRDQFSKELKISIDLNIIQPDFNQTLADLVQKYPGNCNLSVVVFDAKEKVEVTMLSRKMKISPSNLLLNSLQTYRGLKFKLS